MHRRAVLWLVNIGIFSAAIVVLLEFPQYAGYIVYAFLGWFVVSLTTVWFARGTPSAASAAGTPPASGPAGPSRPLASGAAAAPTIAFCIYCAADLPVGAERCPACGHAVRRM